MEYQLEQFKRKTMRRIYAVYVLRKVLHPVVLKILFIIGAAFVTKALVSVKSVIFNMSHSDGFVPLYKFSLSAFANADLPVKIIALTSIAIFAWLVRDIVRNFRKGSPAPHFQM